MATKLLLGFALVTVLAGVVGYEGERGIGVMHDRLRTLYATHALGVAHLKEADIQLLLLSRAVHTLLLDADAAALAKHRAAIQQYEAALFTAFAAYQQGLVSDHDKATAAEIAQRLQALRPQYEGIVQLATASRSGTPRPASTNSRRWKRRSTPA